MLYLARNREALAPVAPSLLAADTDWCLLQRAARQSVAQVASMEQRGRHLTFVAQVSVCLAPQLTCCTVSIDLLHRFN